MAMASNSTRPHLGHRCTPRSPRRPRHRLRPTRSSSGLPPAASLGPPSVRPTEISQQCRSSTPSQTEKPPPENHPRRPSEEPPVQRRLRRHTACRPRSMYAIWRRERRHATVPMARTMTAAMRGPVVIAHRECERSSARHQHGSRPDLATSEIHSHITASAARPKIPRTASRRHRRCRPRTAPAQATNIPQHQFSAARPDRAQRMIDLPWSRPGARDQAAETALASAIFDDRVFERRAVEIRPIGRHETSSL